MKVEIRPDQGSVCDVRGSPPTREAIPVSALLLEVPCQEEMGDVQHSPTGQSANPPSFRCSDVLPLSLVPGTVLQSNQPDFHVLIGK